MTAFFENTRRTLAVLIGFSIPISTALTNILCPLALLLILAEGQYQAKWQKLQMHPIAVLAALLFTMMILGILYTPVSWFETGFMLNKYREFLYIPLFILIFRDNQSRRWGMYAFLTAMGITLFLSYWMVITGWEVGKGTPESPFIFKNYITQGLLISLAAYFIAVYIWQTSQQRWLGSIIVFLAIYNVLFMSAGRTGYLILFCLILLFCYQIYRLRGLLISSLVLAFVSVFIYMSSDILQQRINKVSYDWQDYQQGETHTSVGKRLEFYQNSWTLFTQKPIFGHGTGSFSHQYQQLANQIGIEPTTNPHSDYVMIAVQWGLIGVGVFICLLSGLWYTTRYLRTPDRFQAQGLVITIVVGCLINSLWLDNTEGHIFAYFIGMFYGELRLTSGSR